MCESHQKGTFTCEENIDNFKQKIVNDRQRITALPVLCSDENFDFPLQIISKQLGQKWKGGQFEEVVLGDETVKRKNFGSFKVS